MINYQNLGNQFRTHLCNSFYRLLKLRWYSTHLEKRRSKKGSYNPWGPISPEKGRKLPRISSLRLPINCPKDDSAASKIPIPTIALCKLGRLLFCWFAHLKCPQSAFWTIQVSLCEPVKQHSYRTWHMCRSFLKAVVSHRKPLQYHGNQPPLNPSFGEDRQVLLEVPLLVASTNALAEITVQAGSHVLGPSGSLILVLWFSVGACIFLDNVTQCYSILGAKKAQASDRNLVQLISNLLVGCLS